MIPLDRITKNILNEFKQEFDISDSKDENVFEYLTGYLVTSKFCKEEITNLNFMTTGFKGGDLSIDSLIILVNGEIISNYEQVEEAFNAANKNYGGRVSVKFIFSQAKSSDSFESAQILNFLNGVYRFIDEENIVGVSDEIKQKIRIRDLIYDNFKKLSNNPTVEIYYCTTGKWDENNGIREIINPQINLIKSSSNISNANFTPIGSPEIQDIYKETKRGVEQTITISHKVTLPEAAGISQAFYGFVPLTEYIKLITDSNGNLIDYIFHENVRDFLGANNKTNKKIRETLNNPDKSQLFFALNNGVTVITRDLQLRGERFALYDYQIVNGCQTSHVLYEYCQKLQEISEKQDLTQISSIIVPIKIIHSDDESVISQIVSATNSQTAVSDDDLLARDRYHTTLENYFNSEDNESLRLYYERRNKQYRNFDIRKAQIITKKHMMRVFASMFCQQPTEAARFSGRLQKRVASEIFNERHHPAAYHFAAYSSYKLEELFGKNRLEPENMMSAEYTKLRFHILMLIPFLVFNSKPILEGKKAEKIFREGVLKLEDSESSLLLYNKARAVIDDFLNSDLGCTFDINDVDVVKKSNFTQNLIRFIQVVGYSGEIEVK